LRPKDPEHSLNLDTPSDSEVNQELDNTPEKSEVFRRPGSHTGG
jgi:hypothetical protein